MTTVTSLTTLPPILYEHVVAAALREDLGRGGDLTSEALIDPDHRGRAVLRAREAGVLAGLDCARAAFQQMDRDVRFEPLCPDGTLLEPGHAVATVEGPARALLGAERIALNLLAHLSGVASATRRLVDAVEGTRARICCTRKTTPGLRALEKYAVRAGGGVNHRFGLDDGILIKDNHIAFAGGIEPALRRARERAGHMVKIEVEVDDLDQLDAVLGLQAALGLDAVLLDNMTPSVLADAVARIDRRMLCEASGRISEETAAAIAASGVDLISAGWITHSAPILDIGLDHR